MIRTVLVTGSSGRIGAQVAGRLSQAQRVIGIDRNPGRQTEIVGDVRDFDLVEKLVSSCDAVVHCAALHAPHVGVESNDDFRSINVDATKILLEAAIRHSLHRFVFTSSTSVYGEALIPDDQAVWVDETLEPIPRDIYDETKLQAENLCREAFSQIKTVALRMSRCFPEPEEEMAIYRLYRGIDGRDVAAAHERALYAQLSSFGAYVVSGPTPFEPKDCPQLLVDAAAVIRRRKPWLEEAFAERGWTLPKSIDRVYTNTGASRRLDFRPIHGIASMLAG